MKFVPRELKKTADVSRGQSTNWKFIRNALSVVFCFLCVYFLLGFCAEFFASKIPEKWEAILFQERMPFKGSSAQTFTDAQVVFDRLIKNPGLRPLPYQLIFLNVQVPNAMAFPGGYVGVTSKLLDEVKSEAGLAMVLGHELGHHQQRHCLKRLGRQLLFITVSTLISGQSLNSVITNTVQLAELRYSRRQEREADEFGLKLVFNTYGHTDGCLEFFELIQKDYESGSSQWGELFASHPYTADRINHLRELQKSLP